MTIMQTELYDALMDAGAKEPKARAAAETIAADRDDIKDIKSDIKIIKVFFTVIMAILLPMFWQIFLLYKSLPK